MSEIMSEIVVAIIEHSNKILLVRRKYNEKGKLHWQFPGGCIEEGENENQAIERELFEETNINCKAVRKIGERIHPNTGRTISYWFCSYISGDAYVKDSKELDAVRWMFPPDVFKCVTSDIFKPIKEYLLNKIEEMNLIKGANIKIEGS
jgi:8-oxo-dGTP diphosphatase